jgi:dynein heavy chain 1
VAKPETTKISTALSDQRMAVTYLRPFFVYDGLVTKCLEYATKFEHIMDLTRLRALTSMLTMLNQFVRNIVIYNLQHDFNLSEDEVLAILWSFSGDCY